MQDRKMKDHDNFHPRDAMLAHVLAMALYPCLSVSVCLSVTSRCSINRDEWINVVFGMGASFDQSYTVFLRKFGYLQK